MSVHVNNQCVSPPCVCFMRLLPSLTVKMPSALCFILHSSMSLKLLYTLLDISNILLFILERAVKAI